MGSFGTFQNNKEAENDLFSRLGLLTVKSYNQLEDLLM
jgi:hypothetical protein